MRIMVVFTGGTIGSMEQAGDVIAPEAGCNRLLLSAYAGCQQQRAVTFDTMEPLTTLSENMSVDKWNRLLAALRELDLTLYDGVIVTHGTDTLAYTAALLSLMWQGIAKPLWLVSAGQTLQHPASNGLPNFVQAVEGIAAGDPGVWVAWHTARGEQRRIPGYALRQCDLYTDEMESYAAAQPPVAPSVPYLYRLTYPLRPVVMCVRPYPGIDYTAFQPSEDVRAVLHETYHAGTAPAEGDSTLLTFSAHCRERGVTVYLAPIKPAAPVYASAASLTAEGIRPLAGMTFEMAYARLVVAYSGEDGAPPVADFAD